MSARNGTREAAAAATAGAEQEGRTFVPMKIVGELHGVWRNPDGAIVGEQVVGPIVIYAPGFSRLAQTIEEEWPRVLKEISGG